MAEQNPFVGRHIIQTIVTPLGGCQAVVVQFKHLFGQKLTVKTVGNRIATDRCEHQPQRVDVFAALQCEHCKGSRP